MATALRVAPNAGRGWVPTQSAEREPVLTVADALIQIGSRRAMTTRSLAAIETVLISAAETELGRLGFEPLSDGDAMVVHQRLLGRLAARTVGVCIPLDPIASRRVLAGLAPIGSRD